MASKGVVNGPNQTSPGSRLNSCGPMGHAAPHADVPNNREKSARSNSCGPMGRTHPNMPNPNAQHRFKIEDADRGVKGYDAPVAATGPGSVPIGNPFSGKNTFVPAHLLRDSAKK